MWSAPSGALLNLNFEDMTREQAIATASRYNLQKEVIYEMDHNDCTPEEALAKYDIL